MSEILDGKVLAKKVREELKITDVNRVYMEKGKLQVIPLGKGYAWFDTGSADRLSDASDYVKAIELRQGVQIACLEKNRNRNIFNRKFVKRLSSIFYKKTIEEWSFLGYNDRSIVGKFAVTVEGVL